jgi:hypothetical protein
VLFDDYLTDKISNLAIGLAWWVAAADGPLGLGRADALLGCGCQAPAAKFGALAPGQRLSGSAG